VKPLFLIKNSNKNNLWKKNQNIQARKEEKTKSNDFSFSFFEG
jgi:hypothetical protein